MTTNGGLNSASRQSVDIGQHQAIYQLRNSGEMEEQQRSSSL